MKKLLALLLAVIMTFALVACVQTEEGGEEGEITEEMKYGGHLDIAASNINGNLDPANSGGVYHWPNLVWEAPLSTNADGSIAPGVCNFEVSEDQLTLKLWVRDGMTFHDGSAVEIEDVVASILRRGHKTPSQYVVDYIESTSIENGVATIKFNAYSNKTLLSLTNTLHSVFPKEFCEKYRGMMYGDMADTEYNIDVVDAIGTGPYKVDSERDGEWLKLVRYDAYVKGDPSGTGLASPKNAYFDSITFWNVSDTTASTIQLLANDIAVATLDMTEYETQLEMNNLVQTTALGTKTMYIQFNNMNQENQVHDDVNLRKAICAAIDFVEINEGMWNGGYDLTGTPALNEAYYVDNFEKCDYMGAANVELAKQYLAKSNYNGEPIYYVDNNANMAALIKSYLEKAGINLDVHIKESISEINKGYNNWNFYIKTYSAGDIPSSISNTVFTRCWVSEKKDQYQNIISTSVPGSKEYVDAWKELCKVWIDDCCIPYVGQEILTWTHHKDLVLDYTGSDIYIWNWYWKNPDEHTAK